MIVNHQSVALLSRAYILKMIHVEQPGTRPADALGWQSALILLIVLSLTIPFVLWCGVSRTGAVGYALAAGISSGLAVAAWRMRAVTHMGAITGGILCMSLYCSYDSAEGPAWRSPMLPLILVFALTHLATRFRRSHKRRAGTAEGGGGRSASQVAANIGVAAGVASVWTVYPWLLQIDRGTPTAMLSILVAALAEAAADTVSSEIGKSFPEDPWLITTRQRVPPGSDGAVSIRGTLAGCTAAAMVVLASMLVLPLSATLAAIAMVGATLGLFFDSLLGATFENWGWLNNDAVNFLSTLFAAVATGLMALLT